MTRILVVGYYGFANTGDEAILAAMIDHLGEEIPGALFVVASGNPEETAALHGVEAIDWTDVPALIDAAEAADLLVLGGGGLFHDYWGFDPDALLTRYHSGLSHFAGVPMLGRLTDKPVMLYAVGVGPLLSDAGRQTTRTAFLQASAATVRDPSSRALLESLGVPGERVEVAADPAFALEPAPDGRVAEILEEAGVAAAEEPLLGVALRHWDVDVQPAVWQRQVAEGLDRFLARHGGRVLFVPFQELEGELDDARVAAAVRESMERSGSSLLVPPGLTPREKAGVLGACDLVLAMRGHAAIFALAAAVPTVALVYDPKVREAMAAAGVAELALDLGGISGASVEERLGRAWRRREPLRRLLETSSVTLAERARESARRAARLLDEGASDHGASDGGTSDEEVRALALRLARTGHGQALAIESLRWDASVLQGQLEERQRQVERLSERLAEEAAWLHGEVATRDREVERLRSELAGRDELVRELRQQEEAAAAATAQLDAIHGTRWWRLADRTWRARRRLAGLFGRARPAEEAPKPPPYDVVLFPIIDWELRYQRPQQLMTQQALHGHRVFYVRIRFHQQGPDVLLEEIREGVWGLRLPGPSHLDLYTHRIEADHLEELAAALDRFRHQHDLLGDVVSYLQLPFWLPLAAVARERWGWKMVYDCIDHHGGFSNTGPAMLSLESRLLEEADLVVASSAPLAEQAAPHARRLLVVRNATELEHFAPPAPPPPELAGITAPVIGYYGAICDWFDVDMVRSAAEGRPDWFFVLVGGAELVDLEPLERLPNVLFTGEKPYAELPGYLHAFDVATIPFLKTPLTHSTNPVKVYEYFSAGKPVVAVDLPELVPMEEHLYLVREPDDFLPRLEEALAENDPARAQARIDLARRNTWEDRHAALEAAFAELWAEKGASR